MQRFGAGFCSDGKEISQSRPRVGEVHEDPVGNPSNVAQAHSLRVRRSAGCPHQGSRWAATVNGQGAVTPTWSARRESGSA